MPSSVFTTLAPMAAAKALAAAGITGHEVAAVYTRPPRPAGRGWAERPSPVHEAAVRFGLPVHTPESLRDEAVQAAFAGHAADAAIVVAYGLILPRPILAAPRHGCLNLHASLLPRWRGAAPIQRAIIAGDRETGVSIMRMEEGLDTGPVCLVERVAIGADDTAGTLHDRLAQLGADLTAQALAAVERGSLDCLPQPEEGVAYAANIGGIGTLIGSPPNAFLAGFVAATGQLHPALAAVLMVVSSVMVLGNSLRLSAAGTTAEPADSISRQHADVFPVPDHRSHRTKAAK